jgi:hypothetical protein
LQSHTRPGVSEQWGQEQWGQVLQSHTRPGVSQCKT